MNSDNCGGIVAYPWYSSRISTWSYEYGKVYYTCYLTISNCYNICNITSIVGISCGATVGNSYCFSEDVNRAVSFFSGFDFDTVWYYDVESGVKHPQLRNNAENAIAAVKISSMPSKTVYKQHEDFDVSGLIIAIQYVNSFTPVEKKAKLDMIIGFDAEKLGKQTVTVSYFGKSDTFEITVNELSVNSVSIQKESINIDIGNTQQLAASIEPANATNTTLTWESDDENIATVNSSGLVTAVGKGTTNIYATSNNGNFDTCEVTVLVPIKELSLDKTSTDVYAGKAVKLNTIIAPDNTTDTISWSSSDTTIATVDSSGLVRAIAKGEAIITATSSRGKTASCTVTVKVAAETVSINKTAIVLDVEEKETLLVTLTPLNSTDKYTWTSSNNSVATVSRAGVVKAVGKGAATITATADSGVKGECEVTVLLPITEISLNEEEITIEDGEQFQLTADYSPLDTTDTFAWKSSDESIVTVENGLVQAVGKGKAVVSAETNRGVKAECIVIVPIHAVGISFETTSKSINIGLSELLCPTLSPANSTDSIVWSSSNPNVVSVNDIGKITAVSKGTTIITATVNGHSSTVNITVLVPATGISLSYSSLNIEQGSTTSLTASLSPANTTDSVTWSTSDGTVATVVNGKITAVKAGTATITATTTSGKTASCSVTVGALPTYNVSYDTNGGVGTPSTQTKTKGIALKLSESKPTKSFVLSYNANGGSVSPASKSLNCIFTGWNTAVNGNGSTYEAGATYLSDAEVKLYAQWDNPKAGNLATPTRSGYSFTGWYTSAAGGEKVTDIYIVSSSLTVYARWEKTLPSNIYNLKDETYNFENYGDSDSCSGHCFGMSVTSAAYYLGILDVTDIGAKKGDSLYSLSLSDAVKSPICHYQQIQGDRSKKAIVAGGSTYISGYSNISSDWKSVINYVKSHDYDGMGTLQIGFRKNGEGGHAINFLRYENVDGQDRIYAYDNNFPNIETYFYMEAGKVYQKPMQTFSGTIDCICLRDINKYFSLVNGFDSTRAIYVAKDCATIQGMTYSYMEGKIDNIEYVMYEIPSTVDEIVIIPQVDNADFIYLGTEYSFGQISDDTYGELKLETMNEGALVQRASFSIKNCKDESLTYGDVDNDGKVTASDARLALRASVGLEYYPEKSDKYIACDVDKDGKITASDARLILRGSVGLEDIKKW